MMSPFFSIIIPVYNSLKYLPECISSINSQSFSDFEVIFIDDGSQDGSIQLIESTVSADGRFKLILQSHKGASSARNAGIRNAIGHYIVFVDSDDKVDVNYLMRIHEDISSNNSDIVVFGGEAFPKEDWIDKKLTTFYGVYIDRWFEALYEVGSRPFMCNKAYRREMLRNYGLEFEDNLILGEDQVFQYKTFPHANVVSFIPDKLYYYRRAVEGSVTAQFSEQEDLKHRTQVNIVDKVIQMWSKGNIAELNNPVFVNWCIEYVYKDVVLLPFNERALCSKKVVQWFEDGNLNQEVLNHRNLHKLKQLNRIAEAYDNLHAPAVSIVVPVFNVIQWIDECINTLVNQSFPNIEVIFVDDGSTDGSLEKILRLSEVDSRVTVIQQEHQYAGVARNKGIQAARGKYLLFLDSDDFFKLNLVEKAYYRAISFDADICAFGASSFDQQTGEVKKLNYICRTEKVPVDQNFSSKDYPDDIFSFTSPAPWSKIFKREFVIKNGLSFQAVQNSNDVFFVYTALATANKIVVLGESLVTYRINTGSSLQSKKGKNPLAFFAALKALKEDLIKRDLYETFSGSYKNFALDSCIFNLTTNDTLDGYREIYQALNDYIFSYIDVLNTGPEDFHTYYRDNYSHMRAVLTMKADDYFALMHHRSISK